MASRLSELREQAIRAIVRNQVVGRRGEAIMKEAWEQCRDADELAIADAELSQIIHDIRGRVC